MLRTLAFRLHSRVFAASTRWAGMLLLGGLASGSVLACTGADAAAKARHDAADEARTGVVEMVPSARLGSGVSMAPAEGLKMRVRQQDTVPSAYLTQGALGTQTRPVTLSASTERNPALAERTPAAQPEPDKSTGHGYKSLAMLAAALVLMVSIALRRSGKR